MKLKREERYISYFHEPIIQGWTTHSSSWRWWRLCWRDGDHAGSAPSEFSPSDLQVQISVSWFLCFRPPPRDLRRGLFLYSVLGQDGVVGEKIDGNGATRLQKVGPMESGRVGHPLLGLRPPLVCFLRCMGIPKLRLLSSSSLSSSWG